MNKKVLMVLTSADQLRLKNGKTHKTGAWAEEFVAPYLKLKKAGFEVDVATIGGKKVPFDPLSLDPKFLKDVLKQDPANAERYRKVINSAKELKTPLKLEDIKLLNKEPLYCGIFIPGGHGVMEDLANSKKMGRLLIAAKVMKTLIAAVCHGPCAFLQAFDSNGNWAFKDVKMTGFTDKEEYQDEPALGGMPLFLQETELRKLGANFVAGDPWTSHVVKSDDEMLITGQNPQSSEEIANVFVRRLIERNAVNTPYGLMIPKERTTRFVLPGEKLSKEEKRKVVNTPYGPVIHEELRARSVECLLQELGIN